MTTRHYSIGLLSILGSLLLMGQAAIAGESVVFKILAVNPSETESKQVTIHGVLPPEVKAENVLDADGLSVEYDQQMGASVLNGTVTLKPKGSIIKKILIEDVWVIPDAQFDRLEREVDDILTKLAGTSFAERGQLMADAIHRHVKELHERQGAPFLDPQQHISSYRDDLKAMQLVETDMVSLRQLMVMAALEPSSQSAMSGAAASAGAASSSPERGSLSILTTWRIIFLILGLLGFISLSFFLVWQRQLKVQLSKQAAQEPSSGDAAGDLFVKNGNGRHAAGAKALPPIPAPVIPSSELGRPGLQPKSPPTP